MKMREPRRQIFIQARMRVDASWHDVTLRNVSSHGLMAQCQTPPPRGAYVEIRRGAQCVIGRIAWCTGENFGLRAQDAIAVASMLNEPVRARHAAPGATSVERRSDVNPRGAEQALRRSNRVSAAIQFAAAVAAIAIICGMIALTVFDALSAPFAAVGRHLAN
jgi:hypothetical protein